MFTSNVREMMVCIDICIYMQTKICMKDFERSYLVHCCCHRYVMCVHHWKVLVCPQSVLKLCHHGLCSMRSAQRESQKQCTVSHQTTGTHKIRAHYTPTSQKQPMLSDIAYIAVFKGDNSSHAIHSYLWCWICNRTPAVQHTIWASIHKTQTLNLY